MPQRLLLLKIPAKALILLLLGYTFTSPAHAGLSESWYMMSGKTKLRIGNHKAASEAFEKTTRLNPKNAEAWRLYGLSLEKQGQTDRAIQAFDSYLALYPVDRDILLKQAKFLSGQYYVHRRRDAIKYYRNALKIKDEPHERYQFAQLLARDQANTGEALAAYRQLVRDYPNNEDYAHGYQTVLLRNDKYLPEATRAYEAALQRHPEQQDTRATLAQLYAKDPARHHAAMPLDRHKMDQEIEHNTQAGQNTPDEAQLTQAEHNAPNETQRSQARRQGHESYVGGEFGIFDDTNDARRLQGMIALGKGSRELGASARTTAELGLERYAENEHGGRRDSIRGGLARLGLQYRFAEDRRLDLRLGYHSLGVKGRNTDFDLRFLIAGPIWRFTPGISRDIIRDSLLSIKGDEVNGRHVGAARLDRAYVQIGGSESGWAFELTPMMGKVSTAFGRENDYLAAEAEGRYVWLEDEGLTWRGILATDYTMFGSDKSRQMDPIYGDTGGYDSQKGKWRQAAKLAMNSAAGQSHYIYVDAGVLREWRLLTSDSDRTRFGFTSRLFYQYTLPTAWRAQGHLLYDNLGSRENRWEARLQANKLF